VLLLLLAIAGLIETGNYPCCKLKRKSKYKMSHFEQLDNQIT
jgi:hypothetical protein